MVDTKPPRFTYQAAADAEPKPMGSASPTAAEKAPGQRRPRFFFSREPKNQGIQYDPVLNHDFYHLVI